MNIKQKISATFNDEIQTSFEFCLLSAKEFHSGLSNRHDLLRVLLQTIQESCGQCCQSTSTGLSDTVINH